MSDVEETESARSLLLDIPDWSGHRPGQHVDIRLTAADGYQATRSYSLSNGPEEIPQITVESVEGGEVSPFLVDTIRVGDPFEIRGPVGGYFVLDESDRPLTLIAGGSGVAPLRSMWRAAPADREVRLIYSARNADRMVFLDEVRSGPDIITRLHLTRDTGPGFVGGRIDQNAIAAILGHLQPPSVYVCGPTAFVESVVTFLRELDVPQENVRTERFG